MAAGPDPATGGARVSGAPDSDAAAKARAVAGLPGNRWRPVEIALWALAAAAFFVFPDYRVLGSQILIVGAFAVSLDLILGYAGIVSLGHAAFFGLGAYTAGLLAVHGWGEPFSGLAAAACIAAVAGFLSSFLVVRGGDLARLMVTLGIGLMLFEVANKASAITGGVDGLNGVRMWKILGVFEFDLFGSVAYGYAFVVALLLYAIARIVVSSPFGLSLRGIREGARRMPAIGVPVAWRLIAIYTIAAGIAGVAGALLAQTTQFVGINVLSFQRSAELLIMVVLGGTGRLYGAMIGAAVFMIARDWLANVNPVYWEFWLGVLLIGVVFARRSAWAARWTARSGAKAQVRP